MPLKIMWEKFASIVLRNRIWCLVATLLFTVWMGYYASKVQLSYEFAKVVPVDDSDYVDYMKFKKQFGEDGNVLVIGVQNEKIYQLEFFNAWYDLSDSIEKIEK